MIDIVDAMYGNTNTKIVKLLDLLKKQLDIIQHDVSIILENQRLEGEEWTPKTLCVSFVTFHSITLMKECTLIRLLLDMFAEIVGVDFDEVSM